MSGLNEMLVKGGGTVVESGTYDVTVLDEGIRVNQPADGTNTYLYYLRRNSGISPPGVSTNNNTIVDLPSGTDNAGFTNGIRAGTATGLLARIANAGNWLLSSTFLDLNTSPYHDDLVVTGLGDDKVTDAQVCQGTWKIRGLVKDEGSGINDAGVSDVISPDFSPNYDIRNNADVAIINNEIFPIRPEDGEAMTQFEGLATTNMLAITNNNVDVGTYEVIVSVEDNDNDRSSDGESVIDGNVLNNVTVCDDDTNGPVAQLLFIGTNAQDFLSGGAAITTNITDAELADINDHIDFVVQWTDPSGVFMTNNTPYGSVNIVSDNGRVIPNWDPISIGAATNEFDFDAVFTNFFGNNGDLVVTTWQGNAFNITNIDFTLDYFVTVSAEDEDNDCRGTYTDPGPPMGTPDGDDVPNDRWVTTNQALQFTITDDDSDCPVVADIHAVSNIVMIDRFLHVTLGTEDRFRTGSGGTGTNRVYEVTDENLATLSAANPLRLSFGANDPSGLKRDATETDTNEAMHINLGTVEITNFMNYSASESTPDPAVGISTNVWNFNTPFSTARIDGFFAAGSNVISATLVDADDDRANDGALCRDQQYGYLYVIDEVRKVPLSAVSTVCQSRPILIHRVFPMNCSSVKILKGADNERRWNSTMEPGAPSISMRVAIPLNTISTAIPTRDIPTP